MWDRKELKANAKHLLKANYWKAVIVGFILALLYGSTGISGGNAARDSDTSDLLAALDGGSLLAIAAVVLGIIALALVINLLLTIFVWNPLEVGCQKFYLNCKEGNSNLGDMTYAFKNCTGHIRVVMFYRTIFKYLWSLLFIIPGIVKSYEYMMIPFILADDPTISRKEAFARSKAMMQGNKWNAFVLDLSFAGWLILACFTLGILDIFFVNPYMYLTHAELYHSLKNN